MSLTKYTLAMPRVIYSGENALENITTILADHYKKVVVFTDKGVLATGLLTLPLELIKKSGTEYEILEDLPVEPSCDQAQAIIDLFKEMKADFIIAIGGGSVMDIAKLASISVTDDYCVRDLLDNPGRGKKFVKTLMIPTTAGTGSEATPNSIVLVPEKELKVGIVNSEMIADYVILDSIMIKKLPRKIAAATGLDALCHAIECYTSNKSNYFSDTFALEALKLIMNNIEESCTGPEAVEAKNAMMIASFYGGVAITASGTTAVHALSYPLGGKYHIPHGVSNAMLLVPVMKFNESMCRERFGRIYDAVNPGSASMTIEEKSKWIVNRLDEIVTNLEIPRRLDEFGVKKEDLEELVNAGMQVTRLLVNNMREVTADDARKIYLEIL
ncbi:MAG: iron-containing alcohol dehydrogenase [Mobilitalea sp.]